MKFSILGFNQQEALSLSKMVTDKNGKEKTIQLDVADLLILQEISDFMNRKKIIKYNIDDKTFFSVQYSVILEDLPILSIKKQALSDRVDKMVNLGIIEKNIVKNQAGSFSAFRLTEKYEDLIYQPTCSELQVQKYSTTSAKVVDYAPKYNTTNTITTNTKKEDTKKDDLFEDCWKSYRRKGSKVESKKEWAKLTNEEKQKVKEHIPYYVSSQSEKTYQKDFERYLKKKIFNNVVYKGNSTLYDPEQMNETGEYRPMLDGFNMIWLEGERCYMTPFEFAMLNDGYTKDNRPSSAVVMHNGIKYQWDVELKDWRKL